MSRSKISLKADKTSSWGEWFDRCARHYKDPRMKMAYYQDGKALPMRIMTNIYEDVWQKIRARKRDVLLDVGGGAGLCSRLFQRRVKKIVATDIAVGMLKDAVRLNPRGTFLACEASALPFDSGRFDRVVCYSVFHYLTDLTHVRKVLSEFMRVLKKDGLVFVGDVLYPPARPASPKRGYAARQQTPLPNKTWWPAALSHDLKKLKIAPAFFLEYCRRRGYHCRILRQDIHEKETASERYDVLITYGDVR
ncbi:MAG: class I SAM-dependent methyltransferase [Candidatus Omnitrophota bacterium]|nr:class I SAM-dependent methyltransferase [Candidatus Omnitrophota bacterium]MDZ4243465.1 class I SAM-dependent methyltransferase [Candidatus Omnitrophota bacterium]